MSVSPIGLSPPPFLTKETYEHQKCLEGTFTIEHSANDEVQTFQGLIREIGPQGQNLLVDTQPSIFGTTF